jgi:hypothetical protein
MRLDSVCEGFIGEQDRECILHTRLLQIGNKNTITIYIYKKRNRAKEQNWQRSEGKKDEKKTRENDS